MDNFFTELFMEFLRDKPTALKTLLEDIERLQNFRKGLDKFLENIDEADMNQENIRQKFRTLIKVNKAQNSMLTKFLIILIAYVQGNNFDSDIANTLSKLGKGDEALRQMLKNKMSGR